ncbi:MAG: DNA primase, partial [Pseudomonadota bacterium]
AAEKADRKTKLAEVTEASVRWFRMQFKTAAASEARAYLERRGLTPETLERFELGFAPREADSLLRHLQDQGYSWDLIEGAGMAVAEEDGRKRDRFIHRITFPIRDPRGRCIGFGGRAMNPNSPAKYLNSNETELFDKGANLYNLGPAREAAGKGQPFLVAEGYMDVIALAQAGFTAAVAPLGTAVTERQLQMLWRVAPEPLIALDGDVAGQKAGLRVADLALPLMQAGQSLRFAVLPEGQDPDDLIRDKGRQAMQAVLDDAKPMISLLWQRATAGKSFDSPERRAMLDRDLRALLQEVKDPALRRHYGEEIARLRTELFGPSVTLPQREDRPWQPRGKGRWQPPAQAQATTRSSAMAQGKVSPDALLEQVALAGLIRHPSLIEGFSDSLENTEWSDPEHAAVAAALLRLPDGIDPHEAQERLEAMIGPETLESLLGRSHVRISPAAWPGATADTARPCIDDALTRLDARRGAEREKREAIEDFDDSADEALTWRLSQAAKRRDQAQKTQRAPVEDRNDSEGFSDYLQGLLDTRVWEKSGKK